MPNGRFQRGPEPGLGECKNPPFFGPVEEYPGIWSLAINSGSWKWKLVDRDECRFIRS
jgi:hypothetical protein